MDIIINHITNNHLSGAFKLTSDEAYQRWRDIKLAAYPAKVTDLLVPITTMTNLSTCEYQEIVKKCNQYNMVVYQTSDKIVNSSMVRAFAENFKLCRLDHHRCTENDGISELTISENGPKEEFIPYTNRPIGWHTDGYYNPESNRVFALMLHCVQPASDGGTNSLLDHEIVYIKLRDENPDYIKALMEPDCMTIPEYTIGDGKVGKQRPAISGPVFLVDPATGRLHMRYTARKHNIIWKNDTLTNEALSFLTIIFNDENSPIFVHKLEAGQGLIANNVLHTRTGFKDEPNNRRLLFRARFLDYVAKA